MRKKKPMTTGECFASDLMHYLDTMYPEIMKQSRSFRTSLKNRVARQVDSLLEISARPSRTPIEQMIDKAVGLR